MNRITIAIERRKQMIANNVATKGITAQKLAEIHKSLDMDLMEYCKFQEVKSLAFAEGKLNIEEVQTIYEYLGVIPETFNKQPLEVKVVLTAVFTELLKARM